MHIYDKFLPSVKILTLYDDDEILLSERHKLKSCPSEQQPRHQGSQIFHQFEETIKEEKRRMLATWRCKER